VPAPDGRRERGKERDRQGSFSAKEEGSERSRKKSFEERTRAQIEEEGELRRKIPKRDETLQDLEKRLNTLTVKYRQSRDRSDKGPDGHISGQPPSIESINTTTDENIDIVDNVDGVCVKGLEEQRKLLEDRLEE